MKNPTSLFAVMVLFIGTFITSAASAANTTTTFQNGVVVSYIYTNNTCAFSIYNTSEAQNASTVTRCEIGNAFGANITGASPIWILIPNFAGLSAYAFPDFGATSEGYPVYNGTVIKTQCGIGNSTSACPGKPDYFYSPIFSMIEQKIGITNGLDGKLPEGVLPNPARDFLMSPLKNSTYSRSYFIRVNVYDPNIFPNATTGKCKAIAPSNLRDPTGNCLTSVSALTNALVTYDDAVAKINADNIVWQVAGKPMMQATIRLVTLNPTFHPNSRYAPFAIETTANLTTPNTDQTGFSFVSALNSTTTTIIPSTIPTTIPQYQYQSSSLYVLYIILILAIIVAVICLALRCRGKRKEGRAKTRKK